LDVGLRQGSGIFWMAPPTRALGMASAKVHAEIVLVMALARALLRRIGCWTAPGIRDISDGSSYESSWDGFCEGSC